MTTVLGSACAQAVTTPTELRTLMQDVCQGQIRLLERHDSRLRYQVRRTDRKGTSLRDYVESHDGSVARLLQRDGRVLTADENDGERERLEALLGSEKLQSREHDEAKNRAYGVDLLRVLPTAMRYALAAEQKPLADVADRQLVVDFEPEPTFHPTTLAQQMLPTLRGRVWINREDHRLLRMELHNVADVNLAWGLLAKVYPGGSIVYEQRRFEDVYTFTRIRMNLRLRELMVRTVALDTESEASHFSRMPNSPSGDDAIKMLLAESVPTQ